MSVKTDNPALVGVHKFQAAGLGLAPFRFVGFSVNVITYPDGTSKAGGSCDYCGAGIANECQVMSADGKRFKVGTDCIAKVGDAGLLQAYKSSPEQRRHQAKLRQARAAVVTNELLAIIASSADQLRALPHSRGFTDRETGQPLTRLDQVNWYLNACGASGRAGFLKAIRAGKSPLFEGVNVMK